MIITRTASPFTDAPIANELTHEVAHAAATPAARLEAPPLSASAHVGASVAAWLASPAPALAAPVSAPPSAAASAPGVVTSMRAAVNALASARSTLNAAELCEIASDPVALLAFAREIYTLQHSNALAARRVFGAMSTLVERMSAEQRASVGPELIARLVESTSFDGAPRQARALVEAFAGGPITDAHWQQLMDASRPDPFNSAGSDATGVGSAGTPDPHGFMRMFLTPRRSNDTETDSAGLGQIPPPSPGISILLLVLAVLARPFR